MHFLPPNQQRQSTETLIVFTSFHDHDSGVGPRGSPSSSAGSTVDPEARRRAGVTAVNEAPLGATLQRRDPGPAAADWPAADVSDSASAASSAAGASAAGSGAGDLPHARGILVAPRYTTSRSHHHHQRNHHHHHLRLVVCQTASFAIEK